MNSTLDRCARMEVNLREQFRLLRNERERQEWITQCSECIRICTAYLKSGNLPVGSKQRLMALISRLKCMKLRSRARMWIGGNLGGEENVIPPIWQDVESAFQRRVVTGVVVNYNHIDPRTFLNDVKRIVVDKVHDAILNYNVVKVNCVFNGEFVVDKGGEETVISVKSFATKNYQLMVTSDLGELFFDRIASAIQSRTRARFNIVRERHKLNFRFIDSYKFLSCGLDKLASYLDRDELKITQSQFERVSPENFELLTRKGVFPYEYVDSIEKLDDEGLPARELFFSSLTGADVSQCDYEHARNVWNAFEVQTLGEYSDLYLKTDVLLLADIFENFRESCLSEYKLDPAYYYTLPGFTWDAMLKYTRVELELLSDVDMILFVERGIRGGLSQCSKRYAKANNKYMDTYDSQKPNKYLMYFDVNNLYGWAMSQYLPHGGFRWLSESEIAQFDLSVPVDSPEGYLLEVDLEYPREIHDAHADLPFCPEHAKPPGKCDSKLLATVYDKKRYVIHYRNLQQCLGHGLRLKTIHRVLAFKQSAWLKSYIDLNTSRRALATTNFEKNLFKLMNNAVFGKTMENVRNHVDVKLLTKWEGRYGAAAMIARPNFHSRTIFSENFIAVEMRRLRVLLNKPLYVGMCILEISKTRLYDFHYSHMLNCYSSDKCSVAYTDTDSLIYELECDDAYEIMKRNVASWFDTSDYEIDNPYGMPRLNKKVLGLMKDENNGKIMKEFVGLRSKMYAFRVADWDVKKAKGVKSGVVRRTIKFDDYVSCLRAQAGIKRRQNCIRSKLHELYSVSEEKVALNPNDDKRYIMDNFITTLPWGHYKI